jgi:mono/diheme cytochrome c family protein
MTRVYSYVVVLAGAVVLVGGLAVCGLMGCGGAGVEGTSATSPPGAAGDQIALGAKLYGQSCASCHGNGGEGGKDAPAVVGMTALPLDPPAGAKHRTTQFHTGADVFAFVKANMPANAPGSLSDEEYAAILAFDLKANGVDMTGKHVDTASAASFVLHP